MFACIYPCKKNTFEQGQNITVLSHVPK